MEVWKKVKGFEGLYEVSNLGNVKSLNYRRSKKEKKLRQGKDSSGYMQVGLFKDGKIHTRRTHRLIAESFLNHTVSGHSMVVDHIDNNPLNNNLNNIQVISNRKNLSKDRSGKSKYTGVSWSRISNKWTARINFNGNYKHLGFFDKEYDAHLAYQKQLKLIEKECY